MNATVALLFSAISSLMMSERGHPQHQ